MISLQWRLLLSNFSLVNDDKIVTRMVMMRIMRMVMVIVGMVMIKTVMIRMVTVRMVMMRMVLIGMNSSLTNLGNKALLQSSTAPPTPTPGEPQPLITINLLLFPILFQNCFREMFNFSVAAGSDAEEVFFLGGRLLPTHTLTVLGQGRMEYVYIPNDVKRCSSVLLALFQIFF